MPQIEVAKPFTLTLASGEQKTYQPGKYEVNEEVAHHWFTLPHLKKDKQDKPEAPPPQHPHEGDTSAAGLIPEKTIDQTTAPADTTKAKPADSIDINATDPLLDEPATTGKSKKGS